VRGFCLGSAILERERNKFCVNGQYFQLGG
jgi:hypothetical protein